MKQNLFIGLVLLSLFSTAQKPLADEVLNAEKSFAAYSVAHGTKEAFLHFFDSSGVVFEKGKAVNGIETWNKKEAGTGVLNWHPVYGSMAASGDLGFTTGPWTFQQKSVDDSVVARGQYSTVWKKDKSGEWKFVVDLGINKTPAFDDAAYQFSNEAVSFVPGTWNNLLNREEKFIRQTSETDAAQRTKLYEQFLSKKTFFLNRNGNLPVVVLNKLNSALQTLPQKIDYRIDGSGISAAGDLGYVYGTTIVKGKTENYLRIWRREGKEWKLVLETLRY
ncbi:nuclear transport factor 2 family protein [Flavisolibacter ginsenosidimutans]|uniref:Nuclear transport factor 2 family protein n=1 Tax=Flavisolibacter ginsenosidimutans TaxID=661481 RepID=A0A5B8UHK0_9BACT|nr:nuclear transport factor 2 family protein [Flavisolibacter ginsenosidimutans]QEC55609.1 nuclear transport factor 2 family protein [Flavisolibacter ginsenosidimutans]